MVVFFLFEICNFAYSFLVIKSFNMKKWTKFVIAISLLVLLFKLFFSFRLEKQHARPGAIPLSTSIKEEIRMNTERKNIEEIIDYCVDFTASKLRFTTKAQVIDLDNSISKTHCVGYAKTCASICNYAFQANNVPATAKPVVGQVYFKYLPLNVCEVLSGIGRLIGSQSMINFTKNHDFVEINTNTKKIYVDACAYDYLYDDLRSIEIKK